jgi:hypothetical protein
LDLDPVLIWDIDETIQAVGGSGLPSMVHAVQEVIGAVDNSNTHFITSGMTKK